jgi:hypothetical protein
MSRVPHTLVCALTAAGLGATALSGCGGDGESVPSDGVAKVGDTVVKKSDFDKWLRINAGGQAGGGRSPGPGPTQLHSLCGGQAQAASAGEWRQAERQPAEATVQAGVSPAQASGHAVPDRVRVGRAGG